MRPSFDFSFKSYPPEECLNGLVGLRLRPKLRPSFEICLDFLLELLVILDVFLESMASLLSF